MQTDTEHLGARRKEEEAGSECRHSAELFWAEGVEVWDVAPKGVTEPGALPERVPTDPAAPRPQGLPILSLSALLDQGPSGWRARTLTTERLGPGSFESLGPQLLGVCVDPGASGPGQPVSPGTGP